jgi:hypothetical protein
VSVRFPHRKRDAACALLLVMLVVACGSDDDASPAITTAPAPPATTTTTIAPDETSTTTTTTPVTTTTVVDESQAVIDAYLAAWEAYHTAANDPSNEALAAELAQFTTGPNLQLALANLENLAESGWAARPNPSAPAKTEVESVEVSDGEAVAIVCERNNEIISEPGAAPDGSDAVINDDIAARRFRVRLVLEGGSWKSSDGEELGSWFGQQECADV